MKVLIVSDTHGRHDYLETIIEREKPLDLVIHLGDAEGAEYYIEGIAECPLEIVAGNNDFYTKLPLEQEIKIGDYKVLMTHGHYYYVNGGLGHIRKAVAERGIDIAMFGHTHRPFFEEDENVIILNPGSISYPRQEGRRPSYMVMDVDEAGKAQILLCYL